MLNRLLSYNYSAVLIFLFAFIIKVALYFYDLDFSHSYEGSIINFNPISPLLSGFLSSLFSVLVGIVILVITERYAKRTDFSLWIVLIFVLLLNFYGFYGFGPEYIGLLAFVFALLYLFHGLQEQNKRRMVLDCFNLSFVLSLGTFFTPHLLFLIPMFWISRLLDGQFYIKSLFASILGYLLPFIIVDSLIFSFYYPRAEFSSIFLLGQLQQGSKTFISNTWSWTQLANIGPLVLLIMSFAITFSNVLSTKIVIRKYNRINAFILIYLAAMQFLGLVPLHWGMMLILVPASYFFSNLQLYNNNRWRKLVMFILLISALLSYPPIMNGIVDFIMVFFRS